MNEASIPQRDAAESPEGITFVRADAGETRPGAAGMRPTSATVRGILADAVHGVDESLADSVTNAKNWRQDYVGIVRALTAASATSEQHAVRFARQGLDSAYARLVVDDGSGSDTPLARWRFDDAVSQARGHLATREVTGDQAPLTTLSIPYQGRDLTGEELAAQLDAWAGAGTIEPGCADAVKRVIAHPEWLSLPGHVVADIGAGAEMGPFEMLCRWGARVLAIDVPRASDRLIRQAEAGAGRVELPVTRSEVGDSGKAGADIVRDTAAVAAWVDDRAGSDTLVLGMHAYADSGMHIRLTLAADIIGQYLRRARPATVLAYLATPTDAFVVPPQVVDAARHAWRSRGRRRVVENTAAWLSRGALFQEPYAGAVPGAPGIADCLISQQGPNYAIAKRLQRWRAVVSQDDGQRVSFNVAPATLTRSVTKNPVLRAVYGGAHRFGVEVFAPETSRALMAALLVHDIMRDDVPAGSAVPYDHPEELFSDNAAHGGLWRTAWAPRSALGVAAVLGAPRLARRS